MFAENWITDVARVCGLPQHAVRERNFYGEGDETFFGQVLRSNQVNKIVLSSADSMMRQCLLQKKQQKKLSLRARTRVDVSCFTFTSRSLVFPTVLHSSFSFTFAQLFSAGPRVGGTQGEGKARCGAGRGGCVQQKHTLAQAGSGRGADQVSNTRVTV